jgi:hypothetical protein
MFKKYSCPKVRPTQLRVQMDALCLSVLRMHGTCVYMHDTRTHAPARLGECLAVLALQKGTDHCKQVIATEHLPPLCRRVRPATPGGAEQFTVFRVSPSTGAGPRESGCSGIRSK